MCNRSVGGKLKLLGSEEAFMNFENLLVLIFSP